MMTLPSNESRALFAIETLQKDPKLNLIIIINLYATALYYKRVFNTTYTYCLEIIE